VPSRTAAKAGPPKVTEATAMTTMNNTILAKRFLLKFKTPVELLLTADKTVTVHARGPTGVRQVQISALYING